VATWGRRVLRIVLMCGIAACSDNCTNITADTSERPAPAPVSSATRTTPPRRSTTPTVPLYSFDNSVPPPELVNSGTDYKKIVRSLVDYGNWIMAHRPERRFIDEIAVAGSKSRAGGYQRLGILRRGRARLYETYSGPTTVDILDESEDVISARLTQHIAASVVVDRSGKIENRTTPGRTRYDVLMVNVAGRWYLSSLAEHHGTNVNL
jgi:hypothetical protein